MCITEEFKNEARKKFIRRKTAWKIFRKVEGNCYRSVFRNIIINPQQIYEIGETYKSEPFSSCDPSLKIRGIEKSTGYFMSYAYKEDALRTLNDLQSGGYYRYSDAVVVKIRVEENVIIGISNSCSFARKERFPTICSTKITLLKESR